MAAMCDRALKPTTNSYVADMITTLLQRMGRLFLIVLGASSAGAVDAAVVIKKENFPMPAPYRSINPKSIVQGPDGNLWFTTDASYIGCVSRLGVFKIFPIVSAATDVAAGPDGNIWITRTSANTISVMSVDGVILNNFIVGGSSMAPGKPTLIVPAPNGHMYYLSTELSPFRVCGMTQTGSVASIAVPGSGAIESMCVGKDKNIWYLKFNPSSIGDINGANDYSNGMPQGVQFGNLFLDSDGMLTFCEPQLPRLGKLDRFGNISEIYLPGNPFKEALVGIDGNLWAIEANSAAVTRYNRVGNGECERFLQVNSICNDICEDAQGDIWFTKGSTPLLSNAAAIGHIALDNLAPFTPVTISYHISPSFDPPVYYPIPEFKSATWAQIPYFMKELIHRHLLRMFFWDADSQRYIEVDENSRPPTNIRGYLVTSCVDFSFQLTLQLVTCPHPIELRPGWNLISVPPTVDGGQEIFVHQVSDFNVVDARFAAVVDPRRSRVVSFLADSLSHPNEWAATTTLDSGKAYWIKNNTTQTLTLTRMNTLTGGVVFMSDSERTGGSGTGTGSSSGDGGSDPTALPPPVPALSAEAAEQSHPCGTGSTVGLVLAMSSLLALRLRRRAA